MTDLAEDLFAPLLESGGNGWMIRETGVAIGERTIAVARDPQGRPSLLVPADGHAAAIKVSTRGLMARFGALSDGGELRDWLIVTCLAPPLDTTFFLLCDDVLDHIRALAGTGDPVTVALEVVDRWQVLMTSSGSPLMSQEKITGLLAELHVLEILVDRIGPTAAFASWAGPDQARIDFRFADFGIEVKGTLQRERFKVTIHGLLQLEDAEVGNLYLFAQQLEQVPSGGDSLPDALGRLVDSGVSFVELGTAVARVGYSPDFADIYEQLRFKVLTERGVLVNPETPRIVPSSFVAQGTAEAVSGVSYALDLTDLTEAQGRLQDPGAVFEGVAP